MYHISAAVGSSCVQGTVFCDDVGSHLVPIWSAAGSPTAGGREHFSGRSCARTSSSFILRTTYPRSSVTPTLAGPSGHRPPDMWRSPEPSPGSTVVPTWLEGHSRGMAPVVAPPKARPGHPGDVHFGQLKPISFILWFSNGQIEPKGCYPNETKPNQMLTTQCTSTS